jgi:hypothetical protein
MKECDNSKIHIKYCDNSTRKIHTSSNFILSIRLLIMFDTLLLRPSLHCNTPLHFTTLHYTSLHFTFHPTTLHYTYRHFTFIYTSLPSHLAPCIYISYCSISLHTNTLDTVQFSSPNRTDTNTH